MRKRKSHPPVAAPQLPSGRHLGDLRILARDICVLVEWEIATVPPLPDLVRLHQSVIAVEQYFGELLHPFGQQGTAVHVLATLRDRLEQEIAHRLHHRSLPDEPKEVSNTPSLVADGSVRSTLQPEGALERHRKRLRRQQLRLIHRFLSDVTRELSLRNAREAKPVRQPATVADLKRALDSGKPYGTILADPPWPYQNQATRAAASDHYPTMTLDALRALPVPQLAANNAHLHLWTTTSFISQALQLLEAWGFTYKTTAVWVKPTLGLGNYWRGATELLLLGVRGRCPFRDHGQPNWRLFPRTGHSQKPEAFRRLIERVSPGPYLELFGRLPVPNWTVWGDEIERADFEAAVSSHCHQG